MRVAGGLTSKQKDGTANKKYTHSQLKKAVPGLGRPNITAFKKD
jgi:hypothetical protein